VETSIHLHGSRLVLIVNVQIYFMVLSGISCYLFSYLLDNRKCWNLTLKLTPIILTVHVDEFLYS